MSWQLDNGASWSNPRFEQTDAHPVVGVSLDDGRAFCEWLTEKERKAGLLPPGAAYRLPKDEEWSVAVGPTKYPWGDNWPPYGKVGNYADANFAASPPGKGLPVVPWLQDGWARTSPVGSYRQNLYGLYDMGGNVWQWCDTEYKASMNDAEALEKHPSLKSEKATDGTYYQVLRGGSWFNYDAISLRSTYRSCDPKGDGAHPRSRNDYDGFRCVLAIPGDRAGNIGDAGVFNGKATDAAIAYDLPPTMGGRVGEAARIQAIMMNGGKKESEEAVIRGLRWLKKNQNPYGFWGSDRKDAMTGFALLSFLGHGETPGSPEFGPAVEKAVDWLRESSANNEGRFSAGTEFDQPGVYEHAIATYALGEYYTMTKDKRVVDLLSLAVSYIVKGQSPDGGWVWGYKKEGDGDTSVTGWQIQAMRAAHLTGLNLPGVESALDKAMLDLKRVQDAKGGFGWTRPGDRYSYSLAGVGVFCTYLWKQKKDESVRNGIEFILSQTYKDYPIEYQGEKADLYAWYYNTQACHIVGGAAWQKWNRLFQTEIVSAQASDGSWPAMKANPHTGIDMQILGLGPFARTNLCILMLETYYRYLPNTK